MQLGGLKVLFYEFSVFLLVLRDFGGAGRNREETITTLKDFTSTCEES